MTRILLITGGSRGIGAATARLAARKGYAVAINYREARDQAEALVAEIERDGGRAMAVQADVASQEQVEAMFRAVDAFGPLAALVNSAGITVGRADQGRRPRAGRDRAHARRQRDRHDAVLPRGGAPHVDPLRRQGRCDRQRLVDGGDDRRPPGPHRLCREQGCDRQLHDRLCPRGRPRGHPRQRAAARHDHDRHDRCGAPRSGPATPARPRPSR